MLSVRLVMQSTLFIRVSAARAISAEEEMPVSTISKPYWGASSLYSAMADSEFTSLVVYMMPMFFASGRIWRIILSWASTGSLSLVPVISPTGVPSALASSAATGSVTAVKMTGMSDFLATPYSACAMGVAMPHIRSTPLPAKLVAIWLAVPPSAWELS